MSAADSPPPPRDQDSSPTPTHPQPDGIPEPGYQLLVDGKPTGPFPLSLVVEGLQSGQIQPSVLAWTEGWSEWCPLSELLPECGPAPVPLPRRAVPAAAKPAAPTAGVGLKLLGALAYPFNGDGLIIIAAGTLFFTVLSVVQVFSLILTVFSTGYLFATLQNIVQSSSMGDDRMPSWPSFDGWGSNLLRPVLLWFASLALCLGPGMVLWQVGATQNNSTVIGLGIALAVGGGVYFPMAILAVARTDSFAGLDPRIVVPSIAAIPGRYAIALAVMAGVLAIHASGSGLADRIPFRPVARLWDAFTALYFAVVQARILGLIYFTSQDRFRWC